MYFIIVHLLWLLVVSNGRLVIFMYVCNVENWRNRDYVAWKQ